MTTFDIFLLIVNILVTIMNLSQWKTWNWMNTASMICIALSTLLIIAF